MSENKHQFHVGDLVDLTPFMLQPGFQSGQYQAALVEAYQNNPHVVMAVNHYGAVKIDARGLEDAFFNSRCLKFATANTTPIDDLI